PPQAIDRVIAAVSEGYAFPSNLDTDQRDAGLHPPSQADLVRAGLRNRQPLGELMAVLERKAGSQRQR
ncbi:MAG: phytanoyl-CoA dioxygenase, partial [Actinomycetota bacterium]|nr:phytanoyl-CoA dioxygenase [Actinomycetota bacterium]